MLRSLFPIAVLVLSLAGCTQVPNIAPVAIDNPANPSAAPGPAFSNTDFLNVAAAVRESDPLAVTAGANLPGAPPSVHASKITSPTAASGMNKMNVPGMKTSGSGMKSMPGMKMNMSKNMGGK